jgi:2-polyprenyl-6-methoxyphenol hydroxylase-like FAD-dependent oxidoreductase
LTFAGLGVTDELIAGGNRAVQLRMHVPGHVLTVPMFDLGLKDTAYPFLLFLSQAETERVLGEHLAAAGVPVQRGVELAGLSNAADAATATLRHRDGREEVVSARYVAGCDGGHSTVRRLAGIRFEGSSYPQTFVLADAEADGVEPGAAHVFVAETGMLFFSRSSSRRRGGCWPSGHPPIARHPIHRSSSTRFRPSPAATPAARP